MISFRFQGKSFSITVIQVYASTTNAEEAEVEQFYKDLQPSKTNTKKKLVEVMESQQSDFKTYKMMLLKCCTQNVSKFGKLCSGHRTGKGQFLFQSQRRAMPKNVQTTIQLCRRHHELNDYYPWPSKSSVIFC